MGEGAKGPEARSHPDWAGVDAAGVWSESHVSYPGRSVTAAKRLAGSRGAVMVVQKSAEAIVAISHEGVEGPNMRELKFVTRGVRCTRETQQAMAEKPERSRRVGGGTAEGTGYRASSVRGTSRGSQGRVSGS